MHAKDFRNTTTQNWQVLYPAIEYEDKKLDASIADTSSFIYNTNKFAINLPDRRNGPHQSILYRCQVS